MIFPRQKNKLVFYGLFCILAVLYVSRAGEHDPTSKFFNPRIAYRPNYSNVRRNEARNFHQGGILYAPVRLRTSQPPFLCIGMPSIRRKGSQQYFHEAIAALFHGMTEDERQQIVFLPFIAHTNPRLHYAYQEPWLDHLADGKVEYNKSSPEYERIFEAEQNERSWEKGLIDYRLILGKCYDTGASYNLIVEDDALALYGWFVKTKEALQKLDPEIRFLYLRLFYSEVFLGWQSQNWPVYLTWSIAITLVVTLLAFILWLTVPTLYKAIDIYPVLGYCIINCAFIIGLCFAAGRLTIFPLKHGVVEMNAGCCAQSLVFPRDVVPELADRLRKVKDGHADQRIDQIAEQMGLKRLALVPSIFQHIGSQTSHEADLPEDIKSNMSLAEQVFNIGFELNDAATLWREHTEKVMAMF